MADIFREVDEDLRRERYGTLWKRYGTYLVGAAALIVLVTVAIVGWRQYSQAQREGAGERFAAALSLARAGQPDAAATAFARLEGAAGYGALARLQEAAALAEAGDREAAVAAYRRLADSGEGDPLLRELAGLKAVLLELDTGEPQALRQRLELLGRDDGPWRFSARELLAFLHLRTGDVAAARATWTGLADDLAAPQGVRARAAEMLAAFPEEG